MKATKPLKAIALLVLGFNQMNTVKAQVFVNEEPRHHPVFQNQALRILNVIIPPKDTTQYHIHHTPSLFIFFSNNTTGSQLKGKEPTEGKNEGGKVLFENLAAPNERIHRVWNSDQITMHVMDIELLFKENSLEKTPIEKGTVKLEVDTAGIRAYRIKLKQGQNFKIQSSRNLILISLGNSYLKVSENQKIKNQDLSPGNFIPIKKNKAFSITNEENKEAELELIEYSSQ